MPDNFLEIAKLVLENRPVSKGVGKLLNTLSDYIGLRMETSKSYHENRALNKSRLDDIKTDLKIYDLVDASSLNPQGKELLQVSAIGVRAGNRLFEQEVRGQERLEAISSKAAEYMTDEVSDEPVSSAWMDQFINSAKTVSDEYVQKLWARILADEVTLPNSFSKRTLMALAAFDRQDIAVVDYWASRCSTFSNQRGLLIPTTSQAATTGTILMEYGLAYNLYMAGVDLGLFGLTDASTYTISDDPLAIRVGRTHDDDIRIVGKVGSTIRALPLSRIGIELIGISEAPVDAEFRTHFLKSLRKLELL